MARKAAVALSEFRVADANAAYRGVPLSTLMENAGKAVAREVARRTKGSTGRIVFFCGKGNNGGDGFVAARELAATYPVAVVFAERPSEVDPKGPAHGPLQAVLADASILKVVWSSARAGEAKALCRGASLLVDCLLGSGISGPPRSPYDALIRLINGLGAPVISVDVPSGFPFTPSVRPQVTLTIEAPKVGMTKANSGRVIPISIGFPSEAWTHTGPGELLLVPRVGDHADKRDRGVLAVVAGGPYSGAPALVALAAHAAGIGLVHVFTPESVADVVRRFDPTLVAHPLPGDALVPGHVPHLLREGAQRRCAALAVGPGLGRAAYTAQAVRELLEGSRLPAVIDADAVSPAAKVSKGSLRHAILTPHSGEFRALSGKAAPDRQDTAGRVRAARAAALSHKTTVLLKGHVSVVTDGTRTKLNDAGVSAMAVGGSGDVLTGVVGALLAKGMSPYDAGRAGAFAAGKAGEVAFDRLGHSLKPTDLIAALPRVFARYLPWWRGKP